MAHSSLYSFFLFRVSRIIFPLFFVDSGCGFFCTCNFVYVRVLPAMKSAYHASPSYFLFSAEESTCFFPIPTRFVRVFLS